ncbi:hypothetical protein D3C71_2051120 [compost metagenome]
MSCACNPIFFSGLDLVTPGRLASTSISEISCDPLPVLPVRATTTMMSQLVPLEMKVLAPLMM